MVELVDTATARRPRPRPRPRPVWRERLARHPQLRRAEPARLRQGLRQRLHRRAAVLRLRGSRPPLWHARLARDQARRHERAGLSGGCYPDRLIRSIPNLYYYAANNPSEATIAKRRSYAATISYLTPPAENAGLYKGLKELGETVASYQTLRESRGAPIVNSIVALAKQCNLDKDVELPGEEDDSAELTLEQRDTIVGKVYGKLMEIESRLLPCGLLAPRLVPQKWPRPRVSRQSTRPAST